MGLGQMEELHLARPQPLAGQAAGAEGQEGLYQMIPFIRGMGKGIAERQQAPDTVFLLGDQPIGSAAGQPGGEEEVDEPRASGQAHEEEQKDHQGRAAEVRLPEKKGADGGCHEKGRNNPLAETFDHGLLGAHKIGQIEHQGDFDEFHGLQTENPQVQPALRPLHPYPQRGQGGDKQKKGQGQGRILKAMENGSRQDGRNAHSRHPQGGKKRLAPEKVVGVRLDALSGDAAGGKNHHQAEGDQYRRDGQKPPVRLPRTDLSPFPAHDSSLTRRQK